MYSGSLLRTLTDQPWRVLPSRHASSCQCFKQETFFRFLALRNRRPSFPAGSARPAAVFPTEGDSPDVRCVRPIDVPPSAASISKQVPVLRPCDHTEGACPRNHSPPSAPRHGLLIAAVARSGNRTQDHLLTSPVGQPNKLHLAGAAASSLLPREHQNPLTTQVPAEPGPERPIALRRLLPRPNPVPFRSPVSALSGR